MKDKINLFILLSTILTTSCFLLFNPESAISVTLMLLAPLAYPGLLVLRFFFQRKKKRSERSFQEVIPPQSSLQEPEEILKKWERENR